MEESSQVRAEESCGDRVRHDEAEIWREPEFERGDGAAERTVDQGGLAQHRTPQLFGVCWKVTFSTGPLLCILTILHPIMYDMSGSLCKLRR